MRFEVDGSRCVIGLLSSDEAVSEMKYHRIVMAPICMAGRISHLYRPVYKPQAQRPQALEWDPQSGYHARQHSVRRATGYLQLLPAHIQTPRLSHTTRRKLRTWLTSSQGEFLEQKYLLNLLPKHQAGERIKKKKKKKKEGIFLVIKSELFTTC